MTESITQKKCSKCGEWKVLSEFNRGKRYVNNMRGQCKACKKVYSTKQYIEHREKLLARSNKYGIEHREERRAYAVKYHAEHPTKNRVHDLVKYNMNLKDYDKLFAAQNGICVICGNPPNGRNLCVDHNHITGEVRGLLCRNCNSALGLFGDSLDILVTAAEYLRVHNPQN